MSPTPIVSAAALLFLLVAADASAQRPSGRCTGGKLGAVAGLASSDLVCHANAALRGTAVDPLCLDRSHDRHADAVARAEHQPPCFTLGDAAAIEGMSDAVVGDLVAALRPSGSADACVRRKLVAAAKKARGRLLCQKRAAMAGEKVDAACSGRVSASFARAFERAEAQLACATTGDAAAIEAAIDAFEASVAAAIRPVTSSRCAKRKFRAVAARAEAKLECQADAADAGAAVDPACLAAAEAAFDTDVAVAETDDDCAAIGDGPLLGALADAYVADSAAALWPLPAASDCAGRKLDVLALLTTRSVRSCHGNALGSGLPVSAECVGAVETALASHWTKVDFAADCQTTGDAPARIARLSAFAADVVAVLVP